MKKIHQKNGFEYRCDRSYQMVIWYFRPNGKKVFIQYTDLSKAPRQTIKADMEAFLSDQQCALGHYEVTLAEQADVCKATARYEEAKTAYEATQKPDWDDNFRGNNPGKIGRRERQLKERMERAKSELDRAIRLQSQLVDHE